MRSVLRARPYLKVLIISLLLLGLLSPSVPAQGVREGLDRSSVIPAGVAPMPASVSRLTSPLVQLTATATSTATPVLTVTPTVLPTATPEPPVTPASLLAFTKAADPEDVTPGDLITYTLTLTNSGGTPLEGLVVSDTVPVGLAYLPYSAGGGVYDPRTREITWVLPDLVPGQAARLTFQARVEGQAPNPLLNRARLSHVAWPRPLTADASTHVLHAAEAVITPEQGGRLTAPGGRVWVDFPAGAVTQPIQATYRSLDARRLPPGRTGLALQFELTARPAEGGANAPPITRFEKSLRLTVNLTGLVDALGPYQTWFVGYREASTGRWVSLPVVDFQPGPVLSVEVDHFTPFGAGTEQAYESGWVLAFNEAQVSLFDGGFTYRYPIPVPPGRGGLQPDLNLSYNSRRVDGLRSWVQADWAGLGWSVDTVEIVRQLTPSSNWRWTGSTYENEFTLLFNGTAYKLEPETGGQYYGRYHTADEQFLSIERRNPPWCTNRGGCTPDEEATNLTQEYWVVRAKDGTVYRLGYSTDSEQVAVAAGLYAWNGGGPPQNERYAGEVEDRVAFRWRLGRIVDAQGNRIDFHYDEERLGYDTEPPADRDRASYLREVCYNQIEVNGEERCGNRIFFVHEPRGTAPDSVADYQADGPQKFYFYQRDYLRSIQVQFWNTATVTHEVLSEYVLTYDEQSQPEGHNNRTRRLKRIAVYGAGGYQDGTGPPLPATTFEYQVYPNKGICHRFWGGECTDGLHDEWDQEAFRYERLGRVDNGYGGVITTTYTTPDGSINEGYWQTKNYRVAWRQTQDRGAVVRQVAYTYPDGVDDRCYDGNDDRVCDDPAGFGGGPSGGKLVGYRTVTETVLSGAGMPVAIMGHDFHLNSAADPTWTLGREIETRVIDPTGPTTLRTVQRTYSDDTAGRPAGVHFIRLDRVDTYAGDTTASHSRTDYGYDAYGNVTRTIEHGNVNGAGDERTTHYRYYPKDAGTTYIVDRVARESRYAGEHPTDDDDPTTLESRTRYHYDLANPNDPLPQPQAWTGEPTQGLLTQVDAWNGGLTGSDGDYAITGYRYDAWGNRTEVTDPLSRTTTTDYDPLFHTYPVTVTNTLGHTTITQYYGVNGAPATGTGAYFGQVEAVTDPNGAATRYTYDAFGRLTGVIRPGDTITSPTTVYTYTDAAPGFTLPLRVQVDRRQDASTVRTSHRFYDGLGRLIETKTPLPDNQQAVQHTAYNAQGLVAEEYVPYAVVAGAGYVAVDTSKPRTSYTYDALGRTTVITRPDGTATTYVHAVERNDADADFAGGREVVYVIDAKGHFVRRSLDAYGRLQTVSEATDTYPNWGQEHRTRYTYDMRGNLTQVTDAANNQTQITYDPLGRKTAMDDPDMGQWSYGYDAAGNLIQQTDARGCTTDFSYDALNRLTGKSYSGSGACSTPAVVYSYDAGANGVGRRTGMSAGGVSTGWGYDARGRVVTEAKTIGALGTYTTTYSYDSQDQVVSMRYPDPTPDAVETGEMVTTTYNLAGQPATLTGSLGTGYVTGATYTPEGRPDVLSLGSNLQVDHDYYLWETPNGQGRLQRLQAGTSSDPTALQDLGYEYDAVGNATRIEDWKAGSPEAVDFGYDTLDRLTGADGAYSASYTYDALGNLLMKNEAGTNDTLEYTDPLHVHAPKVVNGATYTYDANGNLLNRPGDSLTYDAENRLRSVTSGGETVTFTYDGDGRRVLRDTVTDTVAYIGPHYEARYAKTDKREDLDDDCVVTVIDIMQVAAQWGAQGPGTPEDVNDDQVVDVGDIQQVAGQWRETCHVLAGTTKYYSLGGQRIAMRKDGTLYYLFTDHLGSTSVTYNTANGQTQTLRYYPWGSVRSGDVPTDRRFTGQRWDATIDLYDYQARWYDPALGRFVQADTVVPAPANPQSLNRYTYVLNNPLRYTDPTGHRECGVACPDDWIDWQIPFGAAYYGPWDIAQQQANRQAVAAVVSTVFDFAPGAGDAKGLVEVLAGEDLVTGERLGAWRWLGLLGLSEVRTLRHADELPKASVIRRLLPARKIHYHHIFPQQEKLGAWFARKGIDIDLYTVPLEETTHLAGVHGRGGFVGPGKVLLSGRWNARWEAFMEANPDATVKEIFQFAGQLMDEFGLNGLPIVPYPR